MQRSRQSRRKSRFRLTIISAFWRRTDGDNADTSAGPAHAAAGARRLVARSVQSADCLAGYHDRREVTAGLVAVTMGEIFGGGMIFSENRYPLFRIVL